MLFAIGSNQLCSELLRKLWSGRGRPRTAYEWFVIQSVLTRAVLLPASDDGSDSEEDDASLWGLVGPRLGYAGAQRAMPAPGPSGGSGATEDAAHSPRVAA